MAILQKEFYTTGLDQFFENYNTQREHQNLDYNYPIEIFTGTKILQKPLRAAA